MVQHRDRTTGDVYLILNGNNRFLEGYLIKTVRRRGGGAASVAPKFEKGDRVLVVEGERMGLLLLVVCVRVCV